jgi:hypothetical protein
MLEATKKIGVLVAATVLTACGEPMFENAGSQHSLMEDRETCAMEIDQSPGAAAYRENPSAHPEYASQVFEAMNRCIERKGWKQVRSPQEQKLLSDSIASEVTRTAPPLSISDPKTAESFARRIKGKLAPTAGEVPTSARKD